MRVALPVPLIRDMDAAILEGLGGYSTRGEFIVDAIQERVLELTADGEEDAGAPTPREVSRKGAQIEGADPKVLQQTRETEAASAANDSALDAPLRGFVLGHEGDLSRPEGGPLFGLHNRDYPALWALARLASKTQQQAMPAKRYYEELLQEAWDFGRVLLAIEKRTGAKSTALFPTNLEKRKAAELAFRMFAVGDFRSSADGTFATNGPLFEWGVAGLAATEEDGPLIGVTELGWKLLAAQSGLSVHEPHPEAKAIAFFEHLASHAPADWKGLLEIMRAIGPDGATRRAVLEHFQNTWPQWTANEVSSNSAGYVARAREWGLVELKQMESRYHLTAFGRINGEQK